MERANPWATLSTTCRRKPRLLLRLWRLFAPLLSTWIAGRPCGLAEERACPFARRISSHSCVAGCWVGRIPNRRLQVTLSFENLSSGENRAGCADSVGSPLGAVLLSVYTCSFRVRVQRPPFRWDSMPKGQPPSLLPSLLPRPSPPTMNDIRTLTPFSST